MKIGEFIKKYSLSKDEGVDVWKVHNNYILTHDACEKIAVMENIKISRIESLFQSENQSRFLVTMVMEDPDTGEVMNSISSVGEASPRDCKNIYYGCMAEKRGIDRCVLKLINAYQWGFYSDVEADDFQRQHGVSISKDENKETIKVTEIDYELNDTPKNKKTANPNNPISKSQIELIDKLCVERSIDNSDWGVDKLNAFEASEKITYLFSIKKPKRQSGGISDVAYEMQNRSQGDEGIDLQSEMPK